MTIGIGSDHAGFRYKTLLKAHLEARGHIVRDFGTFSTDPVDYPLFIRPVAEAGFGSCEVIRSVITPASLDLPP